METGIAQPTLYRQPTDDVLVLADAVRERNDRDSWTDVHELLAQLIEWVSIVRVEAWMINGVPRWKLPSVHHVRRPYESEQEVRVVSVSEFARMTMVG